MKFFEGIRVVDLTQVWIGPLVTRIFADLGADVIKVERPSKPDTVRVGFPAGNDSSGDFWNRSSYFISRNAGKRSMMLDLGGAEPLRAEHGFHEIGDVLAVVGAIQHHAFEEVDEVVIDVTEFLNDRSIVAAGVGIGDEVVHRVRQVVQVHLELEKAGHGGTSSRRGAAVGVSMPVPGADGNWQKFTYAVRTRRTSTVSGR